MIATSPAIIAGLAKFRAYAEAVYHLECHLLPDQNGVIGIYSDTPGDPGGATRWGCTLATVQFYVQSAAAQPYLAAATDDASITWLAQVAGRALLPSDIETLPEGIADAILYFGFFVAPHFDQLLGHLLPLEVFDFGMGSGPSHATIALQNLCNVTEDGAIGPQTIAAANDYIGLHGEAAMVESYIVLRDQFTNELVATRPNLAIFSAGWHWRDDALLPEAQALPVGSTP